MLISVVIVVFQDREELKRVLDSVLAHKTSLIEIIVVDGGSTDGTVELLERYDMAVDKWLSERDAGPYDAMNKAVALATGQFIYHINAGDRLLGFPISELQRAYEDGVDMVSFPVSVDGISTFRPSYGWQLKYANTLHHQGTFYRRAALSPYDLKYKVFADFDLNQRLAKQGAKVRIGQSTVALFASGGLSSQRSSGQELFHVILQNHGVFHVAIAHAKSKYDGFKRRLFHGWHKRSFIAFLRRGA